MIKGLSSSRTGLSGTFHRKIHRKSGSKKLLRSDLPIFQQPKFGQNCFLLPFLFPWKKLEIRNYSFYFPRPAANRGSIIHTTIK